jgi:tetratricopeptide (TPR) repeat protein
MALISTFRRLIRVAAWATPYLQRWHREFNKNRTESERHMQAGNFGEAQKYLELALADAERRRSPAKRKIAILLQLAEARRRQERWNAAAEAAAEALERASAGGKRGPQYGECLDVLSAIHLDQEHYAEAERLAGESLEFSAANGDAAGQAKGWRRLAGIQRKAGKQGEVGASLMRCLEFQEKALGRGDPGVADVLTELGQARQTSGNPRQALECLRRALAIHSESAGADSPEAVEDMRLIAVACHASGNIEEAAQEYERVLQLRERQVGGDPAALGEMLADLAGIYSRMGRYSRAQELLQQALCALDRSPARRDAARESLACIYEKTGRMEAAAELRR